MWITLGVKGLTVALSSYFFAPFTHLFFFFWFFFFLVFFFFGFFFCLFACLFVFFYFLFTGKFVWIYARNCDADADFRTIFFQIIDHPMLNIIWVILILTYGKYSSNNTRNFANSIFFKIFVLQLNCYCCFHWRRRNTRIRNHDYYCSPGR